MSVSNHDLAAAVAETVTNGPTADLIPLSHFALDYPQPPEGWALFLCRHAIKFVPDDLDRDCIRRGYAKRLLDERRAHQLGVAARARVAEAEAVEADARWRASLPHGVSALDLPPGVSAGEAMLAAARQSAPRRKTLGVLGGGDSMVSTATRMSGRLGDWQPAEAACM